jgi:hypothetical protein
MAAAGICATSPDLQASRAAASSNPRASAERHYVDARRRSGVPGRNSRCAPGRQCRRRRAWRPRNPRLQWLVPAPRSRTAEPALGRRASPACTSTSSATSCGLARAGDDGLPIRSDLVLAQHARLASTSAWISRSFFGSASDSIDLGCEFARLRDGLSFWASQAPSKLPASATPCAAGSDCWPPPSDEAQKPTSASTA